MGCFGSKDKLSKEDMDFLKSHTRYDESTIKEWYKGFKVSACAIFSYIYNQKEMRKNYMKLRSVKKNICRRFSSLFSSTSLNCVCVFRYFYFV